MATSRRDDVTATLNVVAIVPPFLRDNFTDIRFVIYDILQTRTSTFRDFSRSGPDAKQINDELKGTRAFELTRKNLRLTCKQIGREWTPLFFRSTTICLNPSHDALAFERFFLPRPGTGNVGNIRRLSLGGFAGRGPSSTEPSLHQDKQLSFLIRALRKLRTLRLEIYIWIFTAT